MKTSTFSSDDDNICYADPPEQSKTDLQWSGERRCQECRQAAGGERGYTPRYKHLGIAKPGEGGGLEQVGFHGLEPEHLVAALQKLAL